LINIGDGKQKDLAENTLQGLKLIVIVYDGFVIPLNWSLIN